MDLPPEGVLVLVPGGCRRDEVCTARIQSRRIDTSVRGYDLRECFPFAEGESGDRDPEPEQVRDFPTEMDREELPREEASLRPTHSRDPNLQLTGRTILL